MPIRNESRHYSVSIHPLYRCSQHAFSFVFTDITRVKQRVNHLQSIIDYEEMAYTRYRRMEVFQAWLLEERSFILCFVDIDYFKAVSDQFDHMEGDQYIIRVAEALRKFSPDAVISRMGGDELMVLAEHWSQREADARFECLRNRLLAMSQQPGILYESRVIIMVEPSNTCQASDLLSTANEKMYEHKCAHKRVLHQRQRAEDSVTVFYLYQARNKRSRLQ